MKCDKCGAPLINLYPEFRELTYTCDCAHENESAPEPSDVNAIFLDS